jgi:hypothetical protein
MKTTSILVLIAVSLLIVSIIAVYSVNVHPFDPDRECCDHLFYRAMAGGAQTIPPGNRLSAVYAEWPYSVWFDPANGLTHQPPYAYRPLAPLLARVSGFFPLTFLALLITGTLTGLAALRLTGKLWVALLPATALLLNDWISGFYLRDYMLTDPLAYALTALAVLLLLARRRALFFLTAALALFAKETTFALPLCYLAGELLDRRLQPATLAYLGGVYALYAAFRLLLPVPVNAATLLTAFRGVPAFWTMLVWLVQTFGLLLPLAGLGLLCSRPTLALLPLAGVAALTVLHADPERTLIHAYPLVYLPVAVALNQLANALHGKVRAVLVPGNVEQVAGVARAGENFDDQVIVNR